MQLKKIKKDFKKNILSQLPKEQRNDKIFVSQEFGIYTDRLCQEGRITEKQYNSWMF